MDSTPTSSTSAASPIAPGILLGMSFAAFFDGIVLHQLLQWHHMLSNVESPTSVAGLEANTFWDGVFLAGAATLAIAGLTQLWQSSRLGRVPNAKALFATLLLGVGGFNLTEGLIDHHLLQIHHVKSGPHEPAWDFGFLAISLVLAIAGWLLLRKAQQSSRPPASE